MGRLPSFYASTLSRFYASTLLLFRERHMIDPEGPADVPIKFVGPLPPDPDQSPLARRRGLKSDDQFPPFIVSRQGLRTFLKGLACPGPENLDLQAALRRHGPGLDIRAEDIFRIGFERHELIEVTEINVLFSREYDPQRTFSLEGHGRVEGDFRPGHFFDSPIETSPQDSVLPKVTIRNQVTL